MRVLQLGPYPPPYGGVEVNLVAIRSFLLQHGHECTVLNITRHRKQEGDGVFYPRTAQELIKRLFSIPSDIIHLHIGGSVPLRLLMLALLCAIVPGRRSVLTFHSGGYPRSQEGRSARRWTLRGMVFRRFDRIIVVNTEIAEMFSRFGIDASSIRLICPHVSRGPSDNVSLSPRLQSFFESHSPILLTVGLLEPEYDLPLQINALEAVRQRWPRVGLAIIGSGSIEAELRGLISQKTYAEDVLLCGDVDHDVTLRAMSACDIFLRTTIFDGDSISVREALHLGAPVIATDNGMRPDGVRVVPVSNRQALEEAIIDSSLNAKAPRTGPVNTEADDVNVAAVFELYKELLYRDGVAARESSQLKI